MFAKAAISFRLILSEANLKTIDSNLFLQPVWERSINHHNSG
jgi:hypothetical protein